VVADSPRLSRFTLFAYSAIELPLYGSAILIGLFIPDVYTRYVSFTAVGLIFTVARIWDVVTDPAIGFLSDRTRSRLGRRRPWILTGAPIVGIALYRLFVPPDDANAVSFTFWLFVLWLGWTMVNIPYFAWGAELSDDYEERTRITTLRTAFGYLGAVGILGGAALSQRFLGYGGESGEVLWIAAHAFVLLLPVGVLLLAFRVPERMRPASRISLRHGLPIMLRNRPFLRLVAAFTVSGLGPSLQGPMYALFLRYVVQRPEAAALILLFFYPANILGVWLWGWVAERIGKHRAWMCGMTVMVCATPCYLLVGPGDLVQVMAILFASGIGAGSFNAVPAAMKADVIDVDTLESGEDRAGIYFSAWALAAKAISGLGPGIAFLTLGALGFERGAQVDESGLLALRVFFSGAPVVCYLFGMLLVWGYPITAERHAEIRAALDARRTEQT
jgi:Na+/melibiose symporter-like transporter